MIDMNQIKETINCIKNTAIKHMDLIFAYRDGSDKVSQGSGEIISYSGNIYFVTAKHVTDGFQYIFAGAFPKADTDFIKRE